MRRTFAVPVAVTVVGLLGALVVGGPGTAAIVAVLTVLEISLSFDNAVINAGVLARLDARWQRLFLTVGILVAVFGMRLLFPVAVVSLAGHLSPAAAVRLAVESPTRYATVLGAAHASIATFGGAFLLSIFLDFVFTRRDVTWLGWLERPLARAGQVDRLAVAVVLVVVGVASAGVAGREREQVLLAGVVGVASYTAVRGLARLFETSAAITGSTGMASGLTTFLYLEVIDASFSFDDVVAAFAITDRILVIALGLGIGAAYIRGLTVYLVRAGTLSEYAYLEHGAHWAIGVLAVLLFVSLRVSVPEAVTGLTGVGLLAAAVIASVVRRRRERRNGVPSLAGGDSQVPVAR